MSDILLRVAKWNNERFILATFNSCHSCIILFDLWMLKAGMDTFVMIVHFLHDKWEPCHITISFFEIVNIFGNVMALQVSDVLAKYGF
jgi:hypothetical protein